MGRNVKVDIESIDRYSKSICDGSKNIDLALSNIKKLTDEMNNFFNTKTGKKVQETMLEFINNVKIENDSLLEYGERLKKANLLYKSNMNRVKQNLE